MFFSMIILAGALLLTGTVQSASINKTKRDETPLYPFDLNTNQYCSWWHDNDGSIACADLPDVWGIQLADFVRWNPSLAGGCQNFLVNRSYCVEVSGEPVPTTTTITAPATTTTKAGAPGPTQTGQAPNCDRWDFVNPGDTCNTFVAKYPGLTLGLLTGWNAAVGSTCSGLWAETYICTRVAGWVPSSTTSIPATTTTPSNGIVTPTPIREGTVTNCARFYFVKVGDQCGLIATANGITTAQFTTWNPSVGPTCNGLWAEVYVCVGLIGGSTTTRPTTTATTTTGNGIATPTPYLPGSATNCDVFDLVTSGETCDSVSLARGVSVADLKSFNPGVGSSCTGLWLGYYVCVSIVGHSLTTAIPTTTTTRTGNGVATPTPILSGMATNCRLFDLVTSGETCAIIGAARGVTVANIIKWNPAVKSDCTGLWLGYYICVALI